jgi:hypothetical protein
MAGETVGGVRPGEHPLMSNKTLRGIYRGMVEGRLLVGRADAGLKARRAALDDVACFASVLVGLNDEDVVFGCREDEVAERLRGGVAVRRIADGTGRLYAAAGAAMAVGAGRVVVSFFERHEVGGRGWVEALSAAGEFPLLVVVLPRWKGRDREADLCRESRDAGVPGIAVDGLDAVALYRVAQESLGRARAGGGAALVEAVRLPQTGDAVDGLAGYMTRRGVATRGWMRGVEAKFAARLAGGAER